MNADELFKAKMDVLGDVTSNAYCLLGMYILLWLSLSFYLAVISNEVNTLCFQ
jgi:hypothetical protein